MTIYKKCEKCGNSERLCVKTKKECLETDWCSRCKGSGTEGFGYNN